MAAVRLECWADVLGGTWRFPLLLHCFYFCVHCCLFCTLYKLCSVQTVNIQSNLMVILHIIMTRQKVNYQHQMFIMTASSKHKQTHCISSFFFSTTSKGMNNIVGNSGGWRQFPKPYCIYLTVETTSTISSRCCW